MKAVLHSAGWRVGILSVALIGSQIVYMQVLASSQWSHFAYMIIAVALLGFGVSGTLLSLFPKWARNHASGITTWSTHLCAFSLMMAVPLAMSELVRFDMMKLFLEEGRSLRLIFTYVCFFLPFFFGATAIGLTFLQYPQKSGQIYAWNLLGSALGGLSAILLLGLLLSTRAAMIFALLVACIGLLQYHSRLSKYWAVVSILLGLALVIAPPSIRLSEYKDLARTLDLPGVQLGATLPSAYGEVQTASAPSLRYAPGLSLQFTGVPPAGTAVFVNGNHYGTLLPKADSATSGPPHILDWTPRGLVYAVRPPAEVLVLGAGAGENVSHAIAREVERVDAVEPHPVVRRLARSHLKSAVSGRTLTDTESPPTTIRWIGSSARSFLEDSRVDEQPTLYDLVVLPEVGQFGGDAGLRATDENYTLTRESLRAIWQLLNDNGTIAVSAWSDYPPRDSLRLAVLLVDLLQANGIKSPDRHLMVLRNWGMVTFILSRTAWSEHEKSLAEAFAQDKGFDFIRKDTLPDHSTQFHAFDDDLQGDLLRDILGGEIDGVLATYIFDLQPPTDQHPYFRHHLKWSEWPAYRELFMDSAAPFLEVGFPILLLTFLQIAIISLPLILLPLVRMRRTSGGFLRTFFYFSGIGCGFMLWQISMIPQYTLYWGNPLFATAGVISILLLGMGAGSLYSGTIQNVRRRSGQVTALIAIVLIAYAIFFSPFLSLTLGWDFQWRIALGILWLLPPAFLMGLPFPLGIRWAEDDSRVRIGWAWGLDGYASVISASGAAVLALQFGLIVPVFLAAITYAIASTAISLPNSSGRKAFP